MAHKKIAFVYDAIYPYIKGGAEKRNYELGKRLNHDVHLFGMKYWKGEDVIKKNGMTLHGVCKSIPLYDSDRRSIKEAIVFSIKLFRPLMKEDFDVLDCSSFPYFSLFTCKLVCILKRKKLIATWHEVWGKEYWKEYLGFLGIFGYWVEKMAVKMPNKIISVSPHTTRGLRKVLGYSKEIITIPNGISFDEISKVKPSVIKSDVIFAGRLLSHKNVDVLLKAIKIVSSKDKNLKCIIIGDGPEKSRLEELAKTLKISRNIIFKGFLKRKEEVYSLMKSSKVFVLPSSREGFGIAVLEANACGIPVITVNEKSNASKDLILEGKNGYVCKLGEKELADRIIKSLSKDWKTAQYVKDYDWDNISTQLMKVHR
jgi:glycosyltransferase involved in cell wall biosynthesis